MNKKSDILPLGQTLDKYVIDKCMGIGGFSIVYIGHEAESQQHVIIKEYMPNKLAKRLDTGEVVAKEEPLLGLFEDCRKAFFKEATTLVSLKHPNLVNVIGFFRAFGTVYMVMEYQEGKNLENYIRSHQGLSEKFIRTIFPPLLEGLRLVHSRGLLHLDIKPANIHIRPGGSPYLFDFGAVHSVANSRQYQMSQVVTPGFSPVEQHTKGGYVGSWTDIYAIGATMRACIEATSPPSALARQEKDLMKPAQLAFKKKYSQSLLAAIDWSMELDPLLRPQNVDELLQTLQTKEDIPSDGTKNEKDLFGRIADALFLGSRR